MRAKTKKAPLVLVAVFDRHYAAIQERNRFEVEWKQDKTVTVKKFTRMVRVDGVGVEVTAFVVRRREERS